MFVFSENNLIIANKILTRYPLDRKRSAILPLLHLAQKQNKNYISEEIMIYLAQFLDLSVVKVKEVVSFYSMFNQKKVGKYLVQICSTLPCMLRNSEELEKICKQNFGVPFGEMTSDGLFTFTKVECLGDCTNAPVVQINDDYHDNLNGDKLLNLLNCFKDEK